MVLSMVLLIMDISKVEKSTQDDVPIETIFHKLKYLSNLIKVLIPELPTRVIQSYI